MKYDTDIHASLRMNSRNFGDPSSLYLMPSLGQIVWFMTKYLQRDIKIKEKILKLLTLHLADSECCFLPPVDFLIFGLFG